MTKIRSDDIDFQKELLKQCVTGVEPPTFVRLRPEHMSYWNTITGCRAVWTDIDLIHAANLARTLYMIEDETEMLEKEGSVIENQRGTPVMNPRHAVIEQLSRRSVTLSAKLHVHAAATIGEVENNKKKNHAKQKMNNAVKTLEDDDCLLAQPTVN